MDLADGLLAIGERRTREEGVANIRFHRHEVTSWPVPDPGYDVEGALGGRQAALRCAVLTERDLPGSSQLEQLARIDTAGNLAAWLTDLGGSEPRGVQRRFDAPLPPRTGWELVTGSGARRMLEGLSPAAVERVRAGFTTRLTADSVTDLDVRVLTGTARFSG